MKDIAKLGLVLCIITALSAGILGFANEQTKDRIEELARIASDEARQDVFSEASEFEELDAEAMAEIVEWDPRVLEVYKAKDGSGDVLGYTVKTATSGYGGSIEVVTGISVDGNITGMAVGQNTETPGLGTNAEDPAYQAQYNGMAIDIPVEVVKSAPGDSQIQALTGATITSNGVNAGVNLAVETYKQALSNETSSGNASLSEEANENLRKEAFQEATDFLVISEIDDEVEVIEVHKAINGSEDEIIGYTFKTSSKGYVDSVEVITAISKDGDIVGVAMGQHQETPGVGTEVDCEEFKTAYIGKSVEEDFSDLNAVLGSDEIEVITGATVTAKAFNESVNKAVIAFNKTFS